MTPLRRASAGALILLGVLTGCNGSDRDESIRESVVTCIAEGGGAVGDDASVAIEGGQALAVIGEIEASDALIASCLDQSSRK
jgi:hypothetical protein